MAMVAKCGEFQHKHNSMRNLVVDGVRCEGLAVDRYSGMDASYVDAGCLEDGGLLDRQAVDLGEGLDDVDLLDGLDGSGDHDAPGGHPLVGGFRTWGRGRGRQDPGADLAGVQSHGGSATLGSNFSDAALNQVQEGPLNLRRFSCLWRR